MIEYYTFKHRGAADEYKDEVFLRLVPNLTVAIFNGNKLDSPKSQSLLFSEILSSDEGSKDIDYLNSVFDECLDADSEYLMLRVEQKGIESIRKGDVRAKIVRQGQISLLPNGYFGLSSDDRNDEGILADALVAGTCNEWMDMMVRRISDQTQLKCGNLSAVTLKLNR